MHRTLLIPGLALLALAPACVVRGRVVAPVPVVSVGYVEREPPPARFERIPPPPGPEHVWVAGYWSWDGRAYLWVPGAYQVRPRRGAVWVDGRWARRERGWIWVEGRWR